MISRAFAAAMFLVLGPCLHAQAPKYWSIATADTIMSRWPDYSKAYFNSWTYVNGYALRGFEMLYKSTGNRKYFDYAKRYIDQFIDAHGDFHSDENAKGQTRDITFTNLDNMMTGNTVVMLYEATHDERYRKAAEKIRHALDDYPRNDDGGFWHAKSLTGQMWIDGIFMGQMFLTRYAKSIGDAEYGWNEATRQIIVYSKRAERDHSGLYVHGLFEPGHGDRVATWADAKKRWFQVVDKGDRPDNWTDTSGSAMFTYTIQRGIDLGLLPKKEYAPVVAAGYRGIIANATINVDGLVDISSACDGVGVQASYEKYINYKKSLNAKEAVAGFLWATAIVERPTLPTATAASRTTR